MITLKLSNTSAHNAGMGLFIASILFAMEVLTDEMILEWECEDVIRLYFAQVAAAVESYSN